MGWREWLRDAVDTITEQLSAIGIAVNADLEDEGGQGYIEVDGKKESIKYIPNDEDDFDQIIRSVNALIHSQVQYRKLRSCEGSDGWVYGVLSNADWKEIDANATELTNLLFVPVP